MSVADVGVEHHQIDDVYRTARHGQEEHHCTAMDSVNMLVYIK